MLLAQSCHQAFSRCSDQIPRHISVSALRVHHASQSQVVGTCQHGRPAVPARGSKRGREGDLLAAVDDGLTNIVQGGFDAGIRLGESLDREMVAVRISADERVAVVGSPAYFAEHGKPRHPRDLHAHDCITYRRITGGDIYRWEFTEDGKDFDVAVNGRVLANNGTLVVRAAVEGLGLAHVLASMVEKELDAKRLIRVLAGFCPPFPGYFLYYPSRTHIAPKLRALVDCLRFKTTSRSRVIASEARAHASPGPRHWH